MPLPPDPHRDISQGTFEDSFLAQFLSEIFGEFLGAVFGVLVQVVGWVIWQAVRLVCVLILEGISAWPF